MVKVLNHALIKHKLSIMREEKTSNYIFKQNLDEIAMLMAYEVTKDYPLKIQFDVFSSLIIESLCLINEETDEVKNECLARVKKLTDKVTMYDDIKYQEVIRWLKYSIMH